jgi:glycosyltransferase involved in cell wall biosynthesis
MENVGSYSSSAAPPIHFFKMKLLFVHSGSGVFGGAEGNVRQTATELARRGHTLGLLHGMELPRKPAAEWSDIFSPSFAIGPGNSRGAVENALREFQPDVIYVHKMADLEVLESLLDSGVPQVRMVHDHDIYCLRGYKYNFFTRKICTRPASAHCIFPCGASLARNHGPGFPIKWASYRAKKREIKLNQRFQRLVVYSQYTRDELVRNGFDENKIEIHVPIHPDEAGPPPQNSFSNRNLVLFIGQIIRGKGVDVLLESLAKVKAPFECLILGEGTHRPYCEKLSHRLGLTDRVHFMGFVPPQELKKYYPECSVFAVSSVWPEPFGMVGPEAMRFGLPVVAFDAGGVKEWLQDGYNGYLVPWMDRAAFASRVDELLRNKQLGRQMGEHGREWTARNYDFKTYIVKLEDMFKQVIAEPNNHGGNL